MNLIIACPTTSFPDVGDLQRVAAANGIELVVPSLDWRARSGFRPMVIHGRKSGVDVDVWTGSTAAETVETFGLPRSASVVQMTWHGDVDECACAFAFAGSLANLVNGTILDPNYDERYGVSGAFQAARDALSEVE